MMKHLIPLYQDLVAQSGENGAHLETIYSFPTNYFESDEDEGEEECEGSHEHLLLKKTGIHINKQFEGC